MHHSNRHERARTGSAFDAPESTDVVTTCRSTLDAALAYARAGYRVLRVYGVNSNGTCRCRDGHKCSTPGKHPVGRTGVREASTDECTIRKWFAGRDDFNVGIATGIESGIVVIDVDPRHGGDQSLIELNCLLRTDGAATRSAGSPDYRRRWTPPRLPSPWRQGGQPYRRHARHRHPWRRWPDRRRPQSARTR